MGVTKSADGGFPLATWLAILGGTLTDVPATGQCGWIAFYAVLHNATEGITPMSTETTTGANQLKKQVLNGMLANLVDEAKLHPAAFEAELAVSEYRHAT